MLKQLIHSVFKADTKEVIQITSDIKSFYRNIVENHKDVVDDEPYFNKVISTKYWSYLNYTKGLNVQEQDFLQQGILSILLFLSFHYLDNKEGQIGSNSTEIYKSLMHFHSINNISMKLRSKLMNAIIMVEKKKNGHYDQESNSEIYKSITWTLQNIILTNSNISNN